MVNASQQELIAAESPLRRPLMLTSTVLMVLTFLFSTVAMTGSSLNSDAILRSPWWLGRANGNYIGFSFYGWCIKTGDHPCTAPICQVLATSAVSGASSSFNTQPTLCDGTTPCINNRLCKPYDFAGTTLQTPGGFLYEYDGDAKCGFYSRSMAWLATLSWLLCICKLIHGFFRREEALDSKGRKYLGLVLLFFCFLFGTCALGIFGANCAPVFRKLLDTNDEEKGRMGSGGVTMIISVILWGVAFVCEALVPAGTGTFFNIGYRSVEPDEIMAIKGPDAAHAEVLP